MNDDAHGRVDDRGGGDADTSEVDMRMDDDTVGGRLLDTNQICQFTRGKCTIHKLKGDKIVTKRKKWVLKKNGLYGYSTTRVVTYRCKLGI